MPTANQLSTEPTARQLNEQGIPSPSGADPGRNSHRHVHGWSLRSVIEIVRNPPLHRTRGLEPRQLGPHPPLLHRSTLHHPQSAA
ncbi:recombinase family protein [Umezawaea sp. NPDC059074]|uniref:recombinase family protein n=1 Tax=Umezawaea sp. NPDC059074 TaxID=3346716 RepID=UPI00369CBAC2